MNARKLEAQLAGGDAPVYLLHGDESFLTRQATEWLRQKVLTGVADDFNLDRFDARDGFDPERIAQAARTLPMMAPRRLVWVRNAEAAFGTAADALKPLLTYIESPDPSACLVFQANEKVNKTSTLYKRLAKFACVLEAETPRERELPEWLVGRAEERGRRLHADAAGALVEAVGSDLAALDAALDRLYLYVEGDAIIELRHVEETVPHTRSRTVWELLDALADRNLGKALERAHQLIGQGEHPLKLQSLVVRQFRQLLVGRSARAAGATPKDAALAAGVPPFRANVFARQLGNYQGGELLTALDRLAELDRALKGSKVPPELLFEAALLDLCVR